MDDLSLEACPNRHCSAEKEIQLLESLLPLSRARFEALRVKPIQYLERTGCVDTRTCNYLNEHRVFTVNDLLQTDPEKLRSISGFGQRTLDQIVEALRRVGITREELQRISRADRSANVA